MAGISSAVSAATSVFTCSGISSSWAQRMACMVRSKVPGTPRMESCRSSGGAVQAEPQAFDAVLLQPHQHLARERGGGGRRDGDANAEPARFVDQSIQVLRASGSPPVRINCGIGIAELGDLAQERDAFVEGELLGMRPFGTASARQWRQARAQACVISQ